MTDEIPDHWEIQRIMAEMVQDGLADARVDENGEFRWWLTKKGIKYVEEELGVKSKEDCLRFLQSDREGLEE